MTIEHPDCFVVDLTVGLKDRKRRMWDWEFVSVDVAQVRELTGS